jgi:hypothetical protein
MAGASRSLDDRVARPVGDYPAEQRLSAGAGLGQRRAATGVASEAARLIAKAVAT